MTDPQEYRNTSCGYDGKEKALEGLADGVRDSLRVRLLGNDYYLLGAYAPPASLSRSAEPRHRVSRGYVTQQLP